MLAPFWDPFGDRFGDFWCRRGRSKRKSRFFENVVFMLVFKAKMQVGGSHIETIWHPWGTFSTFGNDVDFRIDFGSQNDEQSGQMGSFLIHIGTKTHQKDHRKIDVKNGLKKPTQDRKGSCKMGGGFPLRTLRSKY